jgi:hypothetical protein
MLKRATTLVGQQDVLDAVTGQVAQGEVAVGVAPI